MRAVDGPARPVVVAVGNPFRRDDGVGVAVLAELARRRAGRSEARGPTADLVELDGEPTRLVDAWDGRPSAVVVDAARVPGGVPGEVLVVERADDLERWDAGVSSHAGGVAEALRLGRVLGRLPGRLGVVGVVAAELGDGPGLSRPVAAAVGPAADAVESLLARHGVEVGRVPR